MATKYTCYKFHVKKWDKLMSHMNIQCVYEYDGEIKDEVEEYLPDKTVLRVYVADTEHEMVPAIALIIDNFSYIVDNKVNYSSIVDEVAVTYDNTNREVILK